MRTSGCFLLLLTILGLVACGSVPVASTDEAPLQPDTPVCPSGSENMDEPTGKKQKTP